MEINAQCQQSLVHKNIQIFLWFPIAKITLTHKLLEMHGWVISTAAFGALVVIKQGAEYIDAKFISSAANKIKEVKSN